MTTGALLDDAAIARPAPPMTLPIQHSTPVVVLNWSRQGGIGLVRSLGRLGIPVWGVNSRRLSPPSFSRYLTGRIWWDFDSHTSEESLEFVCGIAKELGTKPILLPTTDSEALFVAEHDLALRNYYLFPAMPPGLAQSLASKRDMFFLAKRHCIPTPECVFPTCHKDVEQYAKSGIFPVMFKGIDGGLLQKTAGKKMIVVRSPGQLLDYYDRFEDPSHPNVMLQEYIPGGDDTVWMFNGYFNESSDCLLGITGKKIHQYPVHTGLTSLGVCLLNQEVFDLTQAFMRAVGYRGILDIGFRYDARDRKYKVLDVNPRIGASFRLFVAQNGMDMVRALYLDLTGQPVEIGTARDGRKWVVEDLDFISCTRYLMERKLSMSELYRSYRGVEETAFFAWDDPLPFVMMFASAGFKALRR
jgi:predicted ATP-grasp superfamily ATP-dependent carboligase